MSDPLEDFAHRAVGHQGRERIDAAAIEVMAALSDAAVTLGREQDATNFRERAELTARSINTKMWNEQTRFYHDLSLQDIQRPQKSPAGSRFQNNKSGCVPETGQ